LPNLHKWTLQWLLFLGERDQQVIRRPDFLSPFVQTYASSTEWPDQKCSYCLCILPRVARPKVSILSLSLSLSWTSPFVPFHQSPPVDHCATFEPTSFIFTFKPCQFTITSCTVVERWSLTSKLSLSRTLPAADG